MNSTTPTGWPIEFREALSSVLSSASPAKAQELRSTASRFLEFCAESSQCPVLSPKSLSAFEADLRARFCNAIVNRRMRFLFEVIMQGPDLKLRDWAMENWMDKRSIEEMVAGQWWPAIPRLLVPTLQIGEKRRIVRELDNFYRCRQRVDPLPTHYPLRVLFLKEDLSEAAKYQRLSRLCFGLDLVSPGDPDLVTLRRAMRDLHAVTAPPIQRKQPPARRIPEVEALLEDYRHFESGANCAVATIDGRRSALNLLHDLLSASGRSFQIDRSALDLFADFANVKIRDKDEHRLPHRGWCRRTAHSKCYDLAPFIPDRLLRREWIAFATQYKQEAERRGDMKAKEKALALCPADLNSMFECAVDLMRRADEETDCQVREGFYTVIGSLGVMLFLPLRRADLLRLRWDHHLVRECARWTLILEATQKSGTQIGRLRLPAEASRFLDFALLRGQRRDNLVDVLSRRKGEPLLKSPRGLHAYSASAFSALFKRCTRHTPHMMRTLWCEGLIAQGADRTTVGAVLQHECHISQKDYEIVARKIRRLRAVESLARISDDVLDQA